jgi:DnaJ-class molecular chaperone
MTDHYATLGVDRGATPDDIKRAYRRMASINHPDKGGDKNKFQEIQKAYETLSDPNSRAQYDSPQPQGFSFEFGGGPNGFDFDNIFSMFGQRFNNGGPRPGGPQYARSHSTRMSLWVKIEDVAAGGKRTVNVGTQHGTMTIEIDIPLGINDGDHVQYLGIGPQGTDLVVQFRIHPNPKWNRNGLNLTTDQSVSIWDCILGGDIPIVDILGNQISLSIPARTQPGSLLRLRGKGLTDRNNQTGDLLVRIQARIPEFIDAAVIDQIKLLHKK